MSACRSAIVNLAVNFIKFSSTEHAVGSSLIGSGEVVIAFSHRSIVQTFAIRCFRIRKAAFLAIDALKRIGNESEDNEARRLEVSVVKAVAHCCT